MKRLFNLRSATKLALFSTATITFAILAMYGLIRLLASEDSALFVLIVLVVIIIAPLAYVISALIIDRVLNPVRVMIEKVKSVGNRDFNSKIFIESAEDELKEYAVAFNQMSSKISEYIEKQKQFISDASHELVTPITVITGHADMLLRWGKDDPETLSEGLSIIKTEAFAMNELIENLLFFSRTDNKHIAYHKENIDLTRLISDCAAEQRLLHPAFAILFDEPEPLYIHADPEAMKRVLRILFANSVKYSADVKKIEIEAERDGRRASLRFSDCGVGIAPEHLSRIFDRFYRIDDSRTKETGGTGLGLAIAKEILSAHGYSIVAQSKPGAGVTMTIGFSSSNLHDFSLTSS